MTRNIDGSLTAAPAITYTVTDTIDLCPGDCGSSAEQVATVPLSRFEASGLSGDVPLIVRFDAPASELTPFLIPPAPTPTPTPIFPRSGPAKTTGSLLHIRTGPGLHFEALGELGEVGTPIQVITQVHGDSVGGNDVWDQLDRGFVSHRYVAFD